MDQIKKLISGLSTRQRISVIVAALLMGVGIFGFTRWKRENDFRPLYSSMALEDAAAVTQKLHESAVEYRLSESGRVVSVPSAKLAESRLALAAAGLPKTGRLGFEIFDKSAFGVTDFVEHINYRRALEGELERSVMSLTEVEQARVHITMAKESVFLDKEQPAKASVMLKLRPGARLAQQNVLAITNLVANAVEGLGAEAVSLVDMDGNLLNRPRKPGDPDGVQATSDALEMRQRLERDLVAKVHSTLEPLLGADRFRAGATVDYDLTSADQQEETFDPTHSVMVSSQKTEDVAERASASGGLPGTASNLPTTAPPLRVNAPGGNSRRTENVAYQSSRVIKHTRIPQGIVKRVSLSVLVAQTVRWEGEGPARHRVTEPPPPETIKAIKDLVAAATGLNMERGDQLIVESLPFGTSMEADPMQTTAPAHPVATPQDLMTKWQQLPMKQRLIAGGVAGGIVVLLILGLVVRSVMRRKKRIKLQMAAALPPGGTVSAPELDDVNAEAGIAGEQLAAIEGPTETGEILSRARKLAQNDLTAAANVIRTWVQEPEEVVR